MTAPQLSIGITTRDRPAALLRCLQSLAKLEGLNPDVIVFDDASKVPVTEVLRDAGLATAPRVLRDDGGPGYIVGRNRLAQAYGEDHRFEIETPPEGGFTVIVEIPFETAGVAVPDPSAAKPTTAPAVINPPADRALGTPA